jgi:hypothetical protein
VAAKTPRPLGRRSGTAPRIAVRHTTCSRFIGVYRSLRGLSRETQSFTRTNRVAARHFKRKFLPKPVPGVRCSTIHMAYGKQSKYIKNRRFSPGIT